MTKDEALAIIDDFYRKDGQLFIDGCKGKLTDKDYIYIAQNIQQLKGMAK